MVSSSDNQLTTIMLRLDHINIRTSNLERMADFYAGVLSLRPGPRPDFAFPGAWLYCGSDAVVHLVGVEEELNPSELQIEHIAFQGDDLEAFLATLQDEDVSFRTAQVPGMDVTQVHLRDVDGNHLHVDFRANK